MNLRAAMRSLFEQGAVPIINENDTVAVEELAVGDNDRLSALVASQLEAKLLVLLTDIDGFYDADPRTVSDARLIHLQSFAYDAAGRVVNRFTAPVPAPYTEPALNAGYDLDDRMTSYNGQALTHDADGNLLGAPLPDGPWGGNGTSSNASGAFTWDSRNRLTSVTRGDTAQAISYAYDSEGFLIALTDGGQTTRLTVDPHGGRRSQVLVRTAPDGGKTRYVHGLGLQYEERPDGTLRYYHYDALGSTVALTDASGATTGTAEYGTFGAIASSTGDVLSTPFLWEGRHGVYTDKQTGLHQMRARWYSAQLRRFLNPDPAGFAGGSNFYAFANGNPVSLIDPFGLGAERSDGGIMSMFHTVLDVAGLVPGFGEAADGINALIYAAEGDYVNAGLSGAAMIPFAGWGATAAKAVNRVDNAIDAARAAKNAPRGLAPEIRALSEANITGSGRTVLGHYPGYIEKAQRTGASYFDIGDAWNTLTPAQRTSANMHFLDEVAGAGDQIYLSLPKTKIRSGSALADEIQYLTGEKGYQWINQWSLRPGGN
ncbi:MAG: hypothetical protein CBB60_002170 [Armatimonadetes bacterium Cent15-Ar3]|nr:MAG: hypothetical protein CBB60_002170 [Armatimonadetes bacterium Cent15-Ar3]